MNETNVSIENREIRGVTPRTIYITVVSTASIIISIVTFYFALKADIQTSRDEQNTTNRVNEIRLKLLEERQSTVELAIKDLQDKLNNKADKK
jgi:hypothetical protein